MGKSFPLLICGLFLILIQNAYAQQKYQANGTSADNPPPRTCLEVVVPDTVEGRWKSVEISILDHQISIEKTYTINIGDTFRVPDSPLSLRVDTFLPSFIMNGRQMTSQSNETRNPAAYVVVKKNQKQLFAGWLFSLYPDAHAFHDARYKFNLTGYNPMR